jgi:hypothetical protein
MSRRPAKIGRRSRSNVRVTCGLRSCREGPQHDRVGLRPVLRLAHWSSRKRADVDEVVADLSPGVTKSEPSSRFDSYHPKETSQVRPLDRALRFGDASGWGPPIGRVAARDSAVLDIGRDVVAANSCVGGLRRADIGCVHAAPNRASDRGARLSWGPSTGPPHNASNV